MSPHETDAAPDPPRGGPARRFCVLVLASAGGAGYAPVASGTFGSAVGVVLYVALVLAGGGAVALGVAAVASTGVGVWAADEAERIYAKRDDGRIVIDEVAGQLITLWPITLLSPMQDWLDPLPLLAGFLIFRGFDIAKPGPVRWAERSFPGGQGVMFDDVLAGVLSAVVMAAALASGVFG